MSMFDDMLGGYINAHYEAVSHYGECLNNGSIPDEVVPSLNECIEELDMMRSSDYENRAFDNKVETAIGAVRAVLEFFNTEEEV